MSLPSSYLGVSALIFDENHQVLIVQDKNTKQWRAPSFGVKEGQEPEAVLFERLKTDLSLDASSGQVVAGDFIDGVYLLRVLITDFSGEVKLQSKKYQEFKWLTVNDLVTVKNICPFVKDSLELAAQYLEQSSYKDKYQRALADAQNLLKQTANDKAEFVKYAVGSLVEDLIPVYDHLKLSLISLPESEAENAWVTGVRHVLKQFKDLLNSRGVEEVVTVGQTFDPNTMEAMEGSGDQVIKEIMPGYKLNGRLIKAAKVIVNN